MPTMECDLHIEGCTPLVSASAAAIIAHTHEVAQSCCIRGGSCDTEVLPADYVHQVQLLTVVPHTPKL